MLAREAPNRAVFQPKVVFFQLYDKSKTNIRLFHAFEKSMIWRLWFDVKIKRYKIIQSMVPFVKIPMGWEPSKSSAVSPPSFFFYVWSTNVCHIMFYLAKVCFFFSNYFCTYCHTLGTCICIREISNFN